MAREKLGVAVFVGLIGLTGILASGKFIDADSWLDSLRGQPSSQTAENVTETNAAQTLSSSDTTDADDVSEKAETEVASTTDGQADTSVAPDDEGVKADNEQTMVDDAAEETVVSEQSNTEEVAVATDDSSEDAPKPADAAEELIIPTFDVLRVEPDGSLLVAGIAAPLSEIELVAGSNTLAKATGNARGEFVAVLDDPLGQGDYEIVLRATAPDGSAVTSAETAIVSIPEDGSSEVLALVEAPGEPSRLITKPSAATALVPVEPVDDNSEDPASIASNEASDLDATATDDVEVAKVEEQSKVEAKTEPAEILVRIEAVEIDGPSVFVAGAAKAATRLRVYANDILLGDTIANPDGRFLVEVKRELPVGDYVIRADALGPNGVDVITRAAVPFKRAVGERLAAIAVPAAPALPTTPPIVPEPEVAASEQQTEDATESSTTDTAEQKQATVTEAEEQDTTAETMAKPVETKKATGGAETAETPAIAVTAGEAKIASGEDDVAVNGNQNEVLEPVSDSVIIRRGDTLWHISRRVYGRGVRYTTIYQANQDQIKDPDMIWPGQVFELPEDREGLDN